MIISKEIRLIIVIIIVYDVLKRVIMCLKKLSVSTINGYPLMYMKTFWFHIKGLETNFEIDFK